MPAGRGADLRVILSTVGRCDVILNTVGRRDVILIPVGPSSSRSARQPTGEQSALLVSWSALLLAARGAVLDWVLFKDVSCIGISRW